MKKPKPFKIGKIVDKSKATIGNNNEPPPFPKNTTWAV